MIGASVDTKDLITPERYRRIILQNAINVSVRNLEFPSGLYNKSLNGL
jgi:hypothetical protein